QLHGAAGDSVVERVPFQQLHGDEMPAVSMPDLKDGADVLVIERGRRAGLHLEAFQGLGSTGKIFGKELQGHAAPQVEVFSLIHHAHPAGAQLSKNAIVGNLLHSFTAHEPALYERWPGKSISAASRVMSRGLCKNLEGAVFPFQVEALEDGVDDSVHAVYVHKAHHGPGTPPYLDKAALDDVGGAQLPPQVPGEAEE